MVATLPVNADPKTFLSLTSSIHCQNRPTKHSPALTLSPSEGNGPSTQPDGEWPSRPIARIGCCVPPQPLYSALRYDGAPASPTKFGSWFRGLNERPRTAQRPSRSLERQRTTTPVQRRRTTAAYSPICGSQVHPSQPESPSNLRRSHLTRFSLSADQSSSIAI